MNNKLTSIIAELPEEEDNTNSYRTPKGSFNRSMAIDKDSNEVLSKTEYRPSLPMQNHSIDQLNVHSARVNKVIKKVFDDNLFKSKIQNEESAFLPNKIDTIENNDIILEENPAKINYNDIFNHFCSLNFENERKNIVVPRPLISAFNGGSGNIIMESVGYNTLPRFFKLCRGILCTADR